MNNVAETTIQHLNAETNDRIYGDKILSEHIDNHIAEFVSFQEFVGKEVLFWNRSFSSSSLF